MATTNPNSMGGPYKGLNKPLPTAGPRDLKGNLKGGKGPYGGARTTK